MIIKKVLFVCVHNSARSQMAEAFLNKFGQGRFVAQSAGIEPGKLNPVVIEVMKEVCVDISMNLVKSVKQFIDNAEEFDYVITVCDQISAERCPVFPGKAKRLHMGFTDPASFTGSLDEKLLKTRMVRDQIKNRLIEWINEV